MKGKRGTGICSTAEGRKAYASKYRQEPENHTKMLQYQKEYNAKLKKDNSMLVKPRKPRAQKFPELIRQPKTTAVTHSALQNMTPEKLANTVTAIMDGRIVLSM